MLLDIDNAERNGANVDESNLYVVSDRSISSKEGGQEGIAEALLRNQVEEILGWAIPNH